jgi:hypothetical protein
MSRRLGAGSARVFAALALAAVVPTAAAAQNTAIDWSRPAQAGPPSRIEDTWVYDSVSARFLMFGGYDLNWNRLNDMWEYNAASRTWADVSPATGARPERRSGQAMAFDPVRRVVIVFGGLLDDLSYLNDTWEWNTVTKTWTNVTPGASPAARQGARLVHDATNGRLVLFGGVDANTFYADTWVWNLSAHTWTPLATTANSPAGRPFVGRTFPGATFNPNAGHGVTVFGGIGYPAGSGTVTDFNDTWELRGTVWTDVTPAGGNPPGRGWTQLVWDPLFTRIVMFAGYRVAAPAQSYGDTWSFANGAWSEIVPQAAGPGIRDSHGMAYDTARNRIVVFGGYLADVLELDGVAWTQAGRTDWPASQDRHVVAYDDDRDVVFLYGGSTEVWEYSVPAHTWTWHYVGGPGGRAGAAVVYERARQKMLLFGGRTRVNGQLGSKNADTWQWDTATRTWTNVSPAVSPAARDDHALAYDPAHNRVILYGGRDAAGTALADTWLWNGSSWTDVTATANGPSARFGAVMAYDAVRQTVVLFGGDTGAQKRNELFEWDGQLVRWVQKFPGGALPQARSFAALSSFDATAPGVVLFGGSGAALLNDSWVWNGTAWTPLTASGAIPTARQYPVLVQDAAAHRVFLYGGRDSRGPSFEFWDAVVTSSATSPVPISVTPSQGTGAQATLVAHYRHAGGASQIANALMLVNGSVNSAGGGYLSYVAATNTLHLRNDTDTAWSGGAVGSAGVLSNGQVTIGLAGVSVSLSGTDLVLRVPIAFQPSFNGLKNIYLMALDPGGAAPAGWLHKGTFLVNAGLTPPTNLVAQTNGLSVALSWTGAPGTLFYQLEAGSTPLASNLGIFNVGTATSVQTSTHAGTYFVRVRAASGPGLSVPSNEVTFVLSPPAACAAPPPPPTGHAVQVANLNVALSWNASAGATSYVLEAGTSSGLANLLNLNVGTATTLAAAGPRGSFFTRVRAVNACGKSEPSNEASFTLGCSAPPVAPTMLTFSKAGSLVTLNWSAAPGAASYRVRVGTAPGLNNLLDADVGGVTGLQANAAGLPTGQYFVRVVAVNTCGISAASNEVSVPLP